MRLAQRAAALVLIGCLVASSIPAEAWAITPSPSPALQVNPVIQFQAVSPPADVFAHLGATKRAFLTVFHMMRLIDEIVFSGTDSQHGVSMLDRVSMIFTLGAAGYSLVHYWPMIKPMLAAVVGNSLVITFVSVVFIVLGGMTLKVIYEVAIRPYLPYMPKTRAAIKFIERLINALKALLKGAAQQPQKPDAGNVHSRKGINIPELMSFAVLYFVARQQAPLWLTDAIQRHPLLAFLPVFLFGVLIGVILTHMASDSPTSNPVSNHAAETSA